MEKNIKAFLDLDLPGRKVLVGGGPQAAELERRYPDALFTGPMEGEELALAYASADVFVFPSLTDTFGLVLLEALASGLPVAAFPASGPKDVLTEPDIGVMDYDLQGRASPCADARSPTRPGRMHSVTAGKIRRGSSSTTCSSPTIAKLPERRRRLAPQQKKTARLGGNRAVSLSCVSLGDAWGISRPPRNG